jgi:hypothetical protein
MKLRKDGQRVYDKLKKEGFSDEDIADGYVFPMEYESEEERKQDEEAMAKYLAESRAKRTPEEQKELDEFVKKLRENG